jgi:hypothetical protein
MLQTVDRLDLVTSPSGTTLVLTVYRDRVHDHRFGIEANLPRVLED